MSYFKGISKEVKTHYCTHLFWMKSRIYFFFLFYVKVYALLTWVHEQWTPNKAFFFIEIQNFRTWSDKFGGIWAIVGQTIGTHFGKGQIISKWFLVSSISSEKRTKTSPHSSKNNSSTYFLEEFEDTKFFFEINWPLQWVPCPGFPLFNHYLYKNQCLYITWDWDLTWAASNQRFSLRVSIVRAWTKRYVVKNVYAV